MVGLSVLHVIRKEDLRKSEDDDIFAPTNIQIAEVSESRENNSSLPGACHYLLTFLSSI